MSEPSKDELLFGRIALHNKILTDDQFQEALALRMRRTDDSHDLGRILKARGFVSDRQYRSIRKAQEKHLKKSGLSDTEAHRAARGLGGDNGGLELQPMGAQVEAPMDLGAPQVAAPEPVPIPEPPAPAPIPVASVSVGDALKPVPRPADAKSRQTVLSMLKKSREKGASDLHLSCGSKPFMRLHGAITPFKSMPLLEDATAQKLISSVVSDEVWTRFYHRNDWDGCVDLGPLGRFRTNILRQRRGVSAIFRVINESVPNLADLGLPEALERFTTYHQGMVLVTGPTGSGKSSTLAALIEIINRNRKDHIITLEDPIEFLYESKSCNVTQRQVELHTKSWENALRAALREDPDVIMVGEMRELSTVRLAITAAETGHLVFGTLHTTNATRTIDRILDVFPPKEQAQIRAMVSESLKGVISQQLVPRADGKGRVCAYELLVTTPAVAHLIRERRTFQLFSTMQTGKKLGMKLMDDSLRELLQKGAITKDEARGRATNPKLFK